MNVVNQEWIAWLAEYKLPVIESHSLLLTIALLISDYVSCLQLGINV